ncbi:MAG: 16S rRNA (cytosine(967)-C(5))-methyltransferase RsmB, partial [Clostridiales Family XIII bacterium]|nr:16S rRNA (cytosine(967)-C(5))-methyltransferase RsmB [Clostridiales Family XIII bacterium]
MTRARQDSERAAAYRVLLDVETKGAYTNLALRGDGATPFVRELVYGVVRRKRTLDRVLADYLTQPAGKLRPPERTLLRMGLYQLLYMDSVPDYAAVSETVALAKRAAHGREGFVNGVLRRAARDCALRDEPAGRPGGTLRPSSSREIPCGLPSGGLALQLADAYSFEPWIVERWLTEFEDAGRVERLLAALNETPRLYIRVNPLKTDPEALRATLAALGFFVGAGLFVEGEGVLGSAPFRDGLFSVQDPGAQIVAAKLGALPGETVVDVCAAPGGKACAVAEGMRGEGRVIAADVNPGRVRLIENEAKRLGLSCVEARVRDARDADPALIGQADRVLCDVPCSGLGTARRRPEVKYKTEADAAALPPLQHEILDAAARYVKPGGALLYATCTILRAENEEVAAAFLETHPAFRKQEEALLLPDADGTDGFYYCLMTNEEAPGEPPLVLPGKIERFASPS